MDTQNNGNLSVGDVVAVMIDDEMVTTGTVERITGRWVSVRQKYEGGRVDDFQRAHCFIVA